MAKNNDVLQLLGELTNSEKAVIAECLHFDSSSSKNISAESFMVSARFQENICCVECGSINTIKNGKRKDGVQKYICKDCHRNFTATSDTVISGSKKALYTWIKYIECMLDDNTLQECADKCHIHLNTAFLWRHKLLEASLKSNENIILDGKIEMDETFSGHLTRAITLRVGIHLLCPELHLKGGIIPNLDEIKNSRKFCAAGAFLWNRFVSIVR